MSKRLLLLAVAVSLIINLIGLNKQGETWDEIAYYNAGRHYFKNLKQLDFQAKTWDANKEHPAIGKWLLGAASLPFYLKGEGVVDYRSGRVLVAIVSALTVGLTFAIAYHFLASNWAAFLAGLITATFPLYAGLSKVYGLDILTAFFFTLTVYFFLLGLKQRTDSFYYWLAAIAMGLTIGIRFTGLILPPLLLALFLLHAPAIRPWRNFWWLKYLVIFPVVALLIFVGSWPWLWFDTRAHLDLTLVHWSPGLEILYGQPVTPSWSYYFHYLPAIIPSLTFFSLIVGLVVSLLKPKPSSWPLILWLAAPLLIWSLVNIKQDGLRYLIMIVPALSVLIAHFWQLVWARHKNLAWLLGVLLIGFQVIGLISTYPYYLDYYNALQGGPARVYAEKKFQISWWGEGLDQAGRWLNQMAPERATVTLKTSPKHPIGKLRADLQIIEEPGDYLVTNPNFLWYNDYQIFDDYQIVFENRVAGAPLVTVWTRR